MICPLCGHVLYAGEVCGCGCQAGLLIKKED